MTAQSTNRLRRQLRGWGIGFLGCTALSLMFGIQGTFRLPDEGNWLDFTIFEMPVWYSVLVLAVPIMAVARRFPLDADRWPRHLLIHIVACVITAWAWVSLAHIGRLATAPAALLPFERDILTTVPRIFAAWVIEYFAIVTLQHALAYRAAYNERGLKEAELRELLARSQLDSLKLQLQPHFLFNTLHTISSSMSHDWATARRLIVDLSELLRYSLKNPEQHEVTLAEEFDFLERYLDIQQTRFRDRVNAEVRADPALLPLLVPRMLLQPLVENAIAHGLRDNQTLQISVKALLARPDDPLSPAGRMRIEIDDNGVGIAPSGSRNERIGLRNTRARMTQLYGSDFTFTADAQREGGTRVVIEIPVRGAPRSPARSEATMVEGPEP